MSYRAKFFSYTFRQRAVFLLSVILTSFWFCSIVVPHCEHIPIVVGTKPTFINRILVLKNLQSEHEHIEERKGRVAYSSFIQEKVQCRNMKTVIHKDI